MRSLLARTARRALAVFMAAGLLGLAHPSGQTARAQQRDDGLDTPLMMANICGAGAPGDVHFTLAATGDTFPHENIQAAAEAQGYDYLFDRVRPYLQAADLSYTNFDGAMLESSPYTGYPAFNYNPKLAAALKNAGISLVSTANNHIMDRGPEGLDATLKVLEQNGIRQHGTVASAAAGQPHPPYLPLTLKRDGASVKVAFLSFSWGTNGIPDPYGQVNLLWQTDEYGQQGGIRQSVLDAIAQAKRENDFVVVAAHWGYEYQFYPDASQIEGAAKMAAAGADVILGAQPHTLQPVDILDTGGRKTLVIYSLANFLASQGAFQAESFSATSVIFYVGLVRQADGKVRVTGYRYLPTIHVDDDTRPAPIPADGYADVIDHVRLEMRDFGGARQVGPDPAALGGRVEVCPGYSFPAASGQRVGGDFAQYYATIGSGATPHPAQEATALIGLPLGPVAQELSGDCRSTVSVLYTERQRLELHPEASWPFRVTGTQIGAEVYRQRYQPREVQRRTDLDGAAIPNDRFRRFYQAYGGLPMFGYPVSGELSEPDATTGQPKTVQYFERARFELVPGAPEDAPPLEQVRLGALGREYPGIAAQCGIVASATAGAAPAPAGSSSQVRSAPAIPQTATSAVQVVPAISDNASAEEGQPGWLPWAGALLVGLALAGALIWDSRQRRQMWQRRLARRRRFAWQKGPAHNRGAPPKRPLNQPPPTRAQRQAQDDELLRRLLES
jgi:capsule synthesis protein PGA_cap